MMHKISILLIFFLISVSYSAHSHKGEKHTEKKAKVSSQMLLKINQSYMKNIKPIFKSKCFDCHSQFTKHPWYSKIPGVKFLIEKDMREGLEHLDLSNDFPFGGHGTPREDLEAIKKVVTDDSMPLLRYKLLNWGSSLTDKEEKAILKWVSDSLELIN